MLSFQRRLDLLDRIPRSPRKISTSQLVELLQSDGHESLSIRKVQRDLEALENLGLFGLEADKRSKPYGWSINLNWRNISIKLMDANSALAFSTLKEVASTLLPESTLNELSPYFEKADVIIKNEKSPLISHWKNSVALVNGHGPVFLPIVDSTVLSQIKKAIYQKKQISADLKRFLLPNKAPVWKRYTYISPLGLIQRESVVTLICCFGKFHKKVYRFPIAFIKDVELTDNDVAEPPHYDFDYIKKSYFKSNSTDTLINLKVLVRKDSYLVMRDARFSEDQTIDETDDPDEVRINATVEDTPKLRAFLRGLGSAIEVVEPLELRAYFKSLAQELLEKYQ